VRFDGMKNTIVLSRGTAIGLEVFCWDSCKTITATTDAPVVAQVFPAHIARPGAYSGDQIQGLALVGMTPGQTVLHVVDQGRQGDYSVTVLP
jgi:hypothetical protein